MSEAGGDGLHGDVVQLGLEVLRGGGGNRKGENGGGEKAQFHDICSRTSLAKRRGRLIPSIASRLGGYAMTRRPDYPES